MKTFQLLSTTLLVLSICFMTTVNAQLTVGPRVGFNLATISSDQDGLDPKSIIGYSIGGVLEVPVNDKFSIQPEIALNRRGFKLEEEEFGYKSEGKATLNYLDVAVLAKFFAGQLDNLNIFFFAGPGFGYALNGKLKAEEEFGGEKESYEIDIDFKDDEYKRTDVRLIVGAGVKFPIPLGQLFMDVRYDLGLVNLDDSGDTDQKNRGLGVGVGLLIPIQE